MWFLLLYNCILNQHYNNNIKGKSNIMRKSTTTRTTRSKLIKKKYTKAKFSSRAKFFSKTTPSESQDIVYLGHKETIVQ